MYNSIILACPIKHTGQASNLCLSVKNAYLESKRSLYISRLNMIHLFSPFCLCLSHSLVLQVAAVCGFLTRWRYSFSEIAHFFQLLSVCLQWQSIINNIVFHLQHAESFQMIRWAVKFCLLLLIKTDSSTPLEKSLKCCTKIWGKD